MVILSDLSKKYSRSYLNLFINDFSKNDLDNLSKLYNNLRLNRRSLFYLQTLYFIDKSSFGNIYSIFINFISSFNIDKSLNKLIDLLISDKRLAILPEVLYYIIFYLKRRLNLEYFKLKSAYPLSDNQVEGIKKFIKRNIPQNIEISKEIDNSLIAGFIIYSDNFLWQYCVINQIKRLKNKIV
jgi:ATP synthase F1 delta subunit